MTMKMGLMGSGIAKSGTPRLQKYQASLCGIDIDFFIDGAGVDALDPKTEVQKRVQEGFIGVNLTHSYEQIPGGNCVGNRPRQQDLQVGLHRIAVYY